jgi:hypothetical protein
MASSEALQAAAIALLPETSTPQLLLEEPRPATAATAQDGHRSNGSVPATLPPAAQATPAPAAPAVTRAKPKPKTQADPAWPRSAVSRGRR